MTSRETLAWTVLAAPALTAAVIALAPRRLVTAVAVAGAFATAALALALAALALGGSGRSVRRRADRGRRRRRAPGRRDRRGRASPACSSRPPTWRPCAPRSSPAGRRERCVLRRALRLLDGAARRAARRQPRRRLAADRGDDRRLGAARRLQREGTGAGGRLEVPDPDLARARHRPGRHRHARRRRPRRRPRRALLAGAPDLRRAHPDSALVAYLLLLAGLAAKIGWAPVHNWLPDAHSEAPPPVSALLSAALLPAVLLVAWRSEHALAPVIGLRGRRRMSCSPSASSRWRSRCRSSGGRWHGSGSSPTRASSTWA